MMRYGVRDGRDVCNHRPQKTAPPPQVPYRFTVGGLSLGDGELRVTATPG